MKNRVHIKKTLFVLCFVLLLLINIFSLADAKVYIDITSPTWIEIPISISAFGSDDAKTVEEVVKNDLYLTGIFSDVDPSVKGAEMVIDVADDGAGLDYERIRNIAIERGLLSEHESPDNQSLAGYRVIHARSTIPAR